MVNAMFMKNRRQVITKRIKIPARETAPETNLFVKVMMREQHALGSRPVIFILPGGPGLDHSTYQSYNCLLDVADIVFHDPRGCGKSDKSDSSTYTMENYIADIDALREALSLEKITPLGKSYGSVCAMGYALQYNPFIDRLILSAGAASYRSLETAKENFTKIAPKKYVQVFEKLWNGEFKSNAELAMFYAETAPLYSNHLKTQIEAYALAYFAKNFSYEALNLGFSDFLRRFDFEPKLHLIQQKTLILAGEDDWINDVRHIQTIAEKIPNNTFKIFPDAGHAIESDVGEEYFHTIRRFILESTNHR